MYFSTNNIDYWYEIHGEGVPIVLLHGFTGSGATWKSFIASAPDGFKFIVIDLPGHGRTEEKGVITMDACCSDIFELLQSLQVSAFYLVGYSLGGRTALSYTVKYPETIKGLILESASPGLADTKEREKRKEKDDKLADKIIREGVDAFVDYWENIPLFDTQKSLAKEVQATIREERIAQRSEGLAHSLKGMGTGVQDPQWEKLKELRCPVLLITGELDAKFVQINKKMTEQLPNIHFEIVEDAGHAVHIEKPKEFNELVMAFANSHSS